jgi:hypothetical protein
MPEDWSDYPDDPGTVLADSDVARYLARLEQERQEARDRRLAHIGALHERLIVEPAKEEERRA